MAKKLTQNLCETNCLFRNKKHINGCSILNDDVKCEPTTCMWKHTEQTYFESLEKAMKNYEKRTGKKDYIDKYVFGITIKEKFHRYLVNKATVAS